MPSAPAHPASPIPVPDIDSDEPVAVIPLASVAPLDGQPDGERINTFALAPRGGRSLFTDAGAQISSRVVRRPLTWLGAAFALGFMMARALR